MKQKAMEYNPDVGRTKLKEMVIVTNAGAEAITRMPVKQLMMTSLITTGE